MASQFQIRTKDIPLLVRALQSLETVPDTWFGSVDDPSLLSEMKNAARALPVKLRLKTLQLSSLDVLALQQACCYQCLECKLSRQDYKLLEDYSNQFAALLASGFWQSWYVTVNILPCAPFISAALCARLRRAFSLFSSTSSLLSSLDPQVQPGRCQQHTGKHHGRVADPPSHIENHRSDQPDQQ